LRRPPAPSLFPYPTLFRSLPPDRLVDAAAVAGVQDTPPGNAGVALAARVRGLRPEDLESALLDERSLLRMLSLRGAAHVVPRREDRKSTRLNSSHVKISYA